MGDGFLIRLRVKCGGLQKIFVWARTRCTASDNKLVQFIRKTGEEDLFRKLTMIFLFWISQDVLASCGGTTHLRPLDVIADKANGLLQQQRFSELDKLAGQYLSKRALASDGQPALMGFFAGVAKTSVNCRAEKITDEAWKAHEQRLIEWGEASKSSVVPILALARFKISYGWYARGSGYASTITEEGWALFRKRVSEGQAILEKIKPKAANNPEWYAGMMNVALAQGWTPEEFDALYASAVRKFPHYLALYFAKGNFYSPNWYGSEEEYRLFVDETVKATERQQGQTMYARLHWSNSRASMFRSGRADWGRMKAGFQQMLKDYPDAWNRNNFASFACMADDRETLAEQLQLLGDNISVPAWGSMDHFKACKILSTTPPGKQCFRREDTGAVFCE